jgi:hypothetical protein
MSIEDEARRIILKLRGMRVSVEPTLEPGLEPYALADLIEELLEVADEMGRLAEACRGKPMSEREPPPLKILQ